MSIDGAYPLVLPTIIILGVAWASILDYLDARRRRQQEKLKSHLQQE